MAEPGYKESSQGVGKFCEDSRLDAILRLSQMGNASIKELAVFALDEAVVLTQSEIGFIGTLSEDESAYTCHATSNSRDYPSSMPSNLPPLDVVHAGFWAEPIRTRKTVVVNDYKQFDTRKKGLPHGHVPVKRFMVVPLFDGDRIVAVASVGNKSVNYNASDEHLITLLMSGMWRFVQRNQANESLLRARDALEATVQLRTEALQKVVQRLEEENLEHLETEKKLWKSEQLCVNMITHSPLGMVLVSLDGRFQQVNEAFSTITGYSQTELLSMTFQDIGMPQDRAVGTEVMARILSGQTTPANVEKRCRHKDGRVVFLQLTTSLLRDKQGVPLYFLTLAQDITQRKETEQELREYRVRLQSLASELTLSEERLKRSIAASLHDSISQSLVMIKFEVASLCDAVTDESMRKSLTHIRDSLGRTLKTVRTLTFDLGNPVLALLGFELAAEKWLQDAGAKYGLLTHFINDKCDKPLSEDVEILLFRSVRELMMNVVKHAKATHVWLSLARSGHEMVVTLRDNGIGCHDQKICETSEGYGLLSVREALSRQAGSLVFESHQGQGTTVTLSVPIMQKETS
ncbi:MAG: PAS domain S-box protein [Phycisphaerae bacterium]|nr:PAS domain S-box protein [Phycisphaerae bacterium]